MCNNTKNRLIAFLVIGLVIIILASILMINALTFKSRQIPVAARVDYSVDTVRAVNRLSWALRFKTVYYGQTRVDWGQFDRFQEFLEKSYPLVHHTLQKKQINDHALLYIWKGSDVKKKAILLTAHQDVMPASDEGWKHPPFSGAVDSKYIWGRGSIDDKGSLMAIMEAIEYLLRSGFRPTRSIYIAFGFDEESGGYEGAAKVAQYLESNKVLFECNVDEGLITLKTGIAGLNKWVCPVGTAEKGALFLRLSVESEGGHGSIVPQWTPAGILSAALNRLVSSPFPASWVLPTSEFTDFIGPETSLTFRIVFANMWLFKPLVKRIFAADPKSDAMIRTTQNPYLLEGSTIPRPHATATVMFTIIPGETVKSVTKRVQSVIKDPRVKIARIKDARDPSRASSSESWAFSCLNRTIREVMPDVVVTPMLVTGWTDARHYARISQSSFRTLPAKVPQTDIGGMHGVNERILISSYIDMINYYIRLMYNMCR